MLWSLFPKCYGPPLSINKLTLKEPATNEDDEKGEGRIYKLIRKTCIAMSSR